MDTKTSMREPGAACRQAGGSIAAIALGNGGNANLLRTWIRAHRERQRACPADKTTAAARHETIPSRVPVTVQNAGEIPAKLRERLK